MWVFNFGQNRRIFHARVLLDGGAIQDIDCHYPQNPRTARLKPCSGRLIRRVSCLCTKKRPRYRGSIGCCGVDPARYARRCRAWASLRAAARSQLRHEGLIAPQAITALSSASAQFRKRRDRKRAHQVLARRGERRVGPLALFCPEMQRLPGKVCWFEKVNLRVSEDVLATLQLSEELSRGAEMRWCEFLVANHEDVAIDESPIERAARLRVHRPGRIEVADLRSGVLCRRGDSPLGR